MATLIASRQSCQSLLLKEQESAAWQKDSGEELLEGIDSLQFWSSQTRDFEVDAMPYAFEAETFYNMPCTK